MLFLDEYEQNTIFSAQKPPYPPQKISCFIIIVIIVKYGEDFLWTKQNIVPYSKRKTLTVCLESNIATFRKKTCI